MSDVVVREAAPLPEPGPIRDALAEQAAARAERAQQAMESAAQAWAERAAGVAIARLKGPRARRGTAYWAPSGKSAAPVELELKAIDGDYVVPDSLVDEIADVMRPVVLRVTADAGQDALDRLSQEFPAPDTFPDDTNPFAVDRELLDDLIDEALESMLGSAGRYAEELRTAITTGESEGVSLDELVERVGEAATKGGNWLRLNARTLGTALGARSALETARKLGVTHVQWVSRRDPRVRATHVLADGQVRPIGEKFAVGRRRLEYPGDPTGLPATADEVHNCRCGLLFATPDRTYTDALGDIYEAFSLDDESPTLDALMTRVQAAELFLPMPDGSTAAGLPGLASSVETPSPVTVFRQTSAPLTVTPGQRIQLPAGTVLGLAPPKAATATTMAILIPAGVSVGVAGGTLLLTDAAVVEVLATGGAGTQGVLRP